LKVAHAAVITPNRCGLYETTRELVAGLRARGVDSRLVDPTKDTNKLYPKGTEDRGAPFADMDWATKADVIVNHSGYDGTPIGETQQPVVHVAHGRPRSSFMSEASGSTPIYSYHYNKNFDPRYKAVVTFWPEHLPYLEVMFPNKRIEYVQSSVDLEAWKPGPKQYDFRGKAGRLNVVISDAWRDDVDPFVPLNAYALWARDVKGAKLHVYGRPKTHKKGWDALLKRIETDGNLGEVQGWAEGLVHVYRAADFVLTANEIDVRTVREAMACGCPVVRVSSKLNGFRTDIAAARDESREFVRLDAERRFNPAETARQFNSVLEGAI
jgi:glycosyltransferase involved in cell wall biosynthesis